MNNRSPTKDEIRKRILAQRNTLTEQEVKQKSAQICHALTASEVYQTAKNILCYVSFANEVDTHALLHHALANKHVFVPRVNQDILEICELKSWSDLSPNHYGILEPQQAQAMIPQQMDLCIVPGIVFDQYRNRIGFGKGYYDRLLKNLTCTKIALAFQCQMIDKIPTEIHDIPMDHIIYR